ncbi:CHASE2 domain-containing protein [Nostoc sp. UHCC 0302]|uniref:CHASE2 domain-containing protein n=1 Tax=Nostoc sp. UHCC 0302 TaxID=3134896 RepID=UPI00311C9289
MSKIKPEMANRRIESFKKRFGKAHLYLAYHAAFPLALTPDLLYRLWANFQRDIQGQALGIPWVGVSDLLLSSLCDEVGHELYEMDLAIRKQLLKSLKEDPDFGKQRFNELANFLLDYIHPQLCNDDPDIQDLAQAQRWTALAYVLPSEAARELALTLSNLNQNQEKAELLRFASLVETVAEPLAEFESLLIYTRGIASFIRGDLESATTQFAKVPIYQNKIQFAGIDLLIPKEIIKITGHSINGISTSKKQKTPTSIIKTFSSQVSSRQKLINNRETPSSKFNFSRLIFISLLITGLVAGIRWLGILQSTEILAFDQMMRSRPNEGTDPRLLIVTIDDNDIANQRQNGEILKGASISDKSLNKLLAKLNQYQPRAIGLDVSRDFPAEQQDLITRLQQTDNLIGVCQGSLTTANTKGNEPPPEISNENLGFNDFIYDHDGVVRRQLLFMNQEATSLCPASYSLSLQLASLYLQPLGIEPKFTPQGNLQLGNTILPTLNSRASGYQGIDANGGQILLNYRSSKQVAEQITLTQFLSSSVNPSAIKDRIVLIGVVAKGDSSKQLDKSNRTQLNKEISGVLVDAHMVSQILSAVLDKRPLLQVWSLWVEVVWIWGWSLAGGLLAWRFQHLLYLALAGGIAIAVLYLVCLGLLISGVWVPFVPAVIGLVITGGSIMFVRLQPLPANQIIISQEETMK